MSYRCVWCGERDAYDAHVHVYSWWVETFIIRTMYVCIRHCKFTLCARNESPFTSEKHKQTYSHTAMRLQKGSKNEPMPESGSYSGFRLKYNKSNPKHIAHTRANETEKERNGAQPESIEPEKKCAAAEMRCTKRNEYNIITDMHIAIRYRCKKVRSFSLSVAGCAH